MEHTSTEQAVLDAAHAKMLDISPEKARAFLKQRYSDAITNAVAAPPGETRDNWTSEAAHAVALAGYLDVVSWVRGDEPAKGLDFAAQAGVDLAAIGERIRPTICETYGSRGDNVTVEGRILAEDFNALMGLFGLPGYAAPPRETLQ